MIHPGRSPTYTEMKTTRKSSVSISWWLAVLQAILVRYAKIDEEWVERVREAAGLGPVVFVLRNRSLIDFLCVRGLCLRHGLPPVGFVSGLPAFVYTPLWLWIARLFRRRGHEARLRGMVEAVESGRSAVVFLRRPAADAIGSRPVAEDGVRLAVEAQGRLGLAVQALPAVFLWGEHAMHRLPGSLDFIFGSNEYPRLLRSMWLLVRRRSIQGAWVADPLDLAAIRGERRIGDEALAGVVRAGVGRRIEKIRRARLGSLTKPSSRVNVEVARSARLRAELEAIAAEEGIPADEIEPRARAIVKRLAADFQPGVLRAFAMSMAFIWRRIYTGIDIRDRDLDALRQAVGKGPLLILPSHKSHIDYIVISQIMRDANIMLPHIAAGQNLSFWPLGWLFRSSGAFFIRRKFINDRFYTAVVSAYVRRLIQLGYSIEVFIEGGRSRTGKLLKPKLGMLEMALRAAATTPGRDPAIMPVFIGYEQVIEEKSYVRESSGRPKKAEGITGLIKTPGVLFHRYGRLHVRCGEPFTFDEVLADLGLERADLLSGGPRRTAAQTCASRTMREINRIAVATPSSILATALLSAKESANDGPTLRRMVVDLVGILRARGAELSDLVEKWPDDPAPVEGGDALDETIAAFVKGGRLDREVRGGREMYLLPAGQRVALDYYKNNIVHFLAPVSIVATSCLAGSEGSRAMADVSEDLALACRLYGAEFPLPRVDDDPESRDASDALADDAIATLASKGIVEVSGDVVTARAPDRLLLLSNALLNYHEMYYTALDTVRRRALGEAKGEISKVAVSRFERLLEEGRLVRPEGGTRLAMRNALLSLKDLRIHRPPTGEDPFARGGIGHRAAAYLERALEAGRAS